MDVFEVHQRLIEEYRDFTTAAVPVRAGGILDLVRSSAELGEQWSDPWISLNPSFASGGTVDELVIQGDLHPEPFSVTTRDGS